MTIFVDLRYGRVIHAVEGKSKKAVLPFLKRLKRYGRKLKAIAMDMSASYFWAVKETLPKVEFSCNGIDEQGHRHLSQTVPANVEQH